MRINGIQGSVRKNRLEYQGPGHGGGHNVNTGIAVPVAAGASTALFTVMIGRICHAVVMPGLLMFRWVPVIGLHPGAV